MSKSRVAFTVYQVCTPVLVPRVLLPSLMSQGIFFALIKSLYSEAIFIDGRGPLLISLLTSFTERMLSLTWDLERNIFLNFWPIPAGQPLWGFNYKSLIIGSGKTPSSKFYCMILYMCNLSFNFHEYQLHRMIRKDLDLQPATDNNQENCNEPKGVSSWRKGKFWCGYKCGDIWTNINKYYKNMEE